MTEDNTGTDWQKIEIHENNLHFRKFLIQAAKKREREVKASRVGKGVCLIEILCDVIDLAQIQTEAGQKLKDKQEKWRNRGQLSPEEATWQKVVIEQDRKEFRDLLVKRARSKRFRARTGSSGDSIYAEVLCHPEQIEQLQESAENILREREWSNNLDNPNYSLYKKLSAHPLKTDDEIQQEQITYLRNMIGELRQALDLFKENKDDHYYDVNVASKNLYREIFNLVQEGKTVIFMLNDGIKRYVRWIGNRYEMTFFKISGDRYPSPVGILKQDAIDLCLVKDIVI